MFDTWPAWLRWILLIPVHLIMYLVLCWLYAATSDRFLGEYDMYNFFSFLFYDLYRSCIMVGVSIYLTAKFAPSHRLIVSIVLMGMWWLYVGYTTAQIPFNEYPFWIRLLPVLMLVGSIGGVVATKYEVK